MDQYLPIINTIVNILHTVLTGTLVITIGTMYRDYNLLSAITADRVKEVKETLETSSTTLAQESTLKAMKDNNLKAGK